MSGAAFRALLVTQLLTGLNLNAFVVKGKRGKAWLATIGMTVLLMPSYVSLVVLQVKMFAFLRSNGLPLESVALVGIYSAAQLMILLASIPAVYATLYQSRELSILLPLPYHPWQIVAAKLGAIYLPELIVGWALFVPALVTYYAYGHAPLALLPVTMVGLILMPAIPLALASIACMLIANIPGIGRNKWFWYVAITTALLGASVMLTAGMSAADAGEMTDLVQVRMRQISQMGRLMPGVQFAMYALADNRWNAVLHQLAHMAVVLGYALMVVLVGSRAYIGPILRGSDAGKSRTQRRSAEAARVRSFLKSVIRKEWICTLKDPAVAMNGLGGYIALPLLAVTYTVMKVQSKGKIDILGEMGRAVHSEAFAMHLPFAVVGIALGLAFFGSLSSLFSASFSKDGKRLWVEKSLPVAPFSILLGKLLAGYALVTPLNLIAIGFSMLVVPLNWRQWIYVALLSQLAIAWNAAFGLSIDCLRPKLVWKDTVQAVKQNVNVVLAMGVAMLGAGANVGAMWLLYRAHPGPLAVYAAALALNAALLACALGAARLAARRLHRIQV